jgi:hypothetical protein
MYELKKFGKIFTNKFVGTEPLSYEKKNLPGCGLTKDEKHGCGSLSQNFAIKRNQLNALLL